MTPEASQDATVPGAPRPNFAVPSSETSLAESLIVLRKRRWILVAAVALGLVVGLYRGISQPKLYTSAGRIEVRNGSGNEFKLNAAAPMMQEDSSTKMQSEVEILQSDTLLLSVARKLNLVNNLAFLGSKTPPKNPTLDDPATRQYVLFKLAANLKVSVIPKTDIIKITYSSLDGKLSADVVNELIADYMDRSYQVRFESTQKVGHWLSGQLDDLKRKVETAQQRMMDLQRKLGVLGVDQTHNAIASSVEDLEKAAGQAELARIIAESRYRMLSSSDPNEIEGQIDISSGPGQTAGGLTGLRTQLATARASYAQLLGTLGPNHPQAKAARAQIDELQKEVNSEQGRLVGQAKQNYLLAKTNEDRTNAALEGEKSSAYKLRDDVVEYTLRQREFDSDRTLYESLLERLSTASVEAGLQSTEIDIVDQAVPPAGPTLQPKSTIVMTSAVVGLIVGVLIAFLLESLDTGLRSVAEIETITELPSLAIIPRSRRATADQLSGMSTVERNINVLTQPKSQFTEAFRSLRTSLLLSSVNGREPRYILFTSATPSEGKTTAATNLAVVLAQSGTRTLLIDADLRRPNVHHRFGLTGKLGLSTILSGGSTLEKSVQTVLEVPALDILASGPVPPFPTEMLSSETMSNLLKQAGELYGYIVIDSPPILSVTDGVLLARQADATVLVVRHGKSSKHVVRRARDLLLRSGAPLSGIVLNAVDLSSPEYYGYYGYSGYSYASIDSNESESTGKSGKNRNGKRDA